MATKNLIRSSTPALPGPARARGPRYLGRKPATVGTPLGLVRQILTRPWTPEQCSGERKESGGRI